MESNNRRLTIGVMVGGITDDVTKSVCKGVFQEAKRADVNVVVFPGKYLERDVSNHRELMYEYQYNTLFSYARKDNIDALIISAGSIGCFLSKSRLQENLKQFADIPCVLVSSKLEGFVSTVFDNSEGIRQGMEYLIHKKGIKKFGMVGGNMENSDARERKQAFVRILEENGIPFCESMYVEGDLSRRCVDVSGKLLADNPGLEAVFCVNDDVAMGFYEALERRGMKAGRDIFVFGYDDTIVATQACPPLSSVRADIGKLGQEALRMAMRMIQGEHVENLIVPTQFSIRESFGRRSGRGNDMHPRNITSQDAGFDDIYYRFGHEENPQLMEELRESYQKWMTGLTAYFKREEEDLSEYAELFACFDEFISLGGVEYADIDQLINVLDKTSEVLRENAAGEKKEKIKDTFSAFYKSVIHAMNNQRGIMNNRKDRENYAIKIFVQDMLQFDKGRDQSYSVLLENLDWLQIKNACIYMFSRPILHLYRENFIVPDEVFVKAILKNGEVAAVPLAQQREQTENLFSNQHIQSEERFSRVLLPLFFKETLYGVLLCDMTEMLYTNGEFLVNQMGSAVKMISLLRANEEIQQQLEDNIVTLRQHNIELDTISKIDVLTGILNRRGFFSEAEERIAKAREASRRILVIYVDMNNLKIINDRYGHEEGDHSLKLIGNFLKELVEGDGIAGRIGGDEYACVLEHDEKEDQVLSRLYAKFADYNRTSEKPYNITVSAGTYVLKPEDTQTLEEALQQADERLYVVKQQRKKEVAK